MEPILSHQDSKQSSVSEPKTQQQKYFQRLRHLKENLNIQKLWFIQCTLASSLSQNTQTLEAFRISQQLINSSWTHLPKIFSIPSFENLQKIYFKQCALISLDFLSYIDTPLLEKIDIQNSLLIGSLKPLNKNLSRNLKVVQIECEFLSSLQQINRVKFCARPSKQPFVLLRKRDKNPYEIMGSNLNLLVKCQFESSKKRYQISKQIMGLKLRTDTALNGQIFGNYQLYLKKTEIQQSLQAKQIKKFIKLLNRFL